MKKCILLVFIACAIASCTGEQHQIGKYVYLDAMNVVHISRKCCTDTKGLNTKYERLLRRRGVQFIDTAVFNGGYYSEEYLKTGWIDYNFCPKCISDEDYSKLNGIINRNRKKNDRL